MYKTIFGYLVCMGSAAGGQGAAAFPDFGGNMDLFDYCNYESDSLSDSGPPPQILGPEDLCDAIQWRLASQSSYPRRYSLGRTYVTRGLGVRAYYV